jgi:hypothetical protein
MRQARLRFYNRTFTRADAFIDNALIPFLAVIVLVGFIYNVSGGNV